MIAQPGPCIGQNPTCPCQDGDACHYEDTPTTKGWPVPDDQTGALRQQPEAVDHEWRDIASAPRDAEIWVYGLAEVWKQSMPFQWQGQAGWVEEDASWWTTSHNDAGEPLKVIPSHWMPLPEPPQTASGSHQEARSNEQGEVRD